MRRFKSIVVVTTLAVIASLGVAGPVGAGPLEGDDPTEERALPECSSLQRFVIDADADVERSKAHAIIGLDGPDADVEFAEVQAAVAASCS